MSHQRFPSEAGVKEPHSVSLKVLRLSRPSLVAQYPVQPPLSSSPLTKPPPPPPPPIPASLAYRPSGDDNDTNPAPFLISPILNLPPSFGSAYVGETFSCTLCANYDALEQLAPAAADAPPYLLHPPAAGQQQPQPPPPAGRKTIRDVRIEAEMKTPGSGMTVKLDLGPTGADILTGGGGGGGGEEMAAAAASGGKGADLDRDQTLQRIVHFDLKEEGNHILAVTVSYYEATETSGRTRTFRKLYQFICKSSLIVRTKPGQLSPSPGKGLGAGRRWVLEAQLENCSEDVVQLERVALELEPGLRSVDCNWRATGGARPVLHPGEVEQVCFVLEELGAGAVASQDGRTLFGVLGIGWRGEMGNRGFLSTGKLGTRHG